MLRILPLPPVIGTEPFCNIGRISVNGEVVLTTEQTADFYGAKVINIQQNFNNNKTHFIEGKHYFKLKSDDFKNLHLESFEPQISSKTRTLYLWTKLGVLRHCKMLNTDKAWAVFEMMENTFFKVLETGSYSIYGNNYFPPELSERWAKIKERENEVKAADVLAKAARLTSSSKFREHLLKQAHSMITSTEFIEENCSIDFSDDL